MYVGLQFWKRSPDGPRSTKVADKNESDYAIYLLAMWVTRN